MSQAIEWDAVDPVWVSAPGRKQMFCFGFCRQRDDPGHRFSAGVRLALRLRSSRASTHSGRS